MLVEKNTIIFEPMPSIGVRRFVDLHGHRFIRLTVFGYGRAPHKDTIGWFCQCDCGRTCWVATGHLKAGTTQSCGCMYRDEGGPKPKHGRFGTPLYKIWGSMIQRCTNPDAANYSHYGERGITVCDRWRTFEHFFADMGERPSRKHTLDRINNDGNYCLENCRWGTPEEQQNNRSNNRRITMNGRTQTVAMWCRELHIKSQTVHSRLHKGWNEIRALITPIHPRTSSVKRI